MGWKGEERGGEGREGREVGERKDKEGGKGGKTIGMAKCVNSISTGEHFRSVWRGLTGCPCCLLLLE